MDHAATTPCHPDVMEAMRPYFVQDWANPSAVYQEGQRARRAVDEARDKVAQSLGASSSSEIVFTGSGTEAANLAVWGAAQGLPEGSHIVASAIEHHAVLEPVRALQARGLRVSWVRPDPDGIVSPAAVEAAMEPQTRLVCVMHANNEVGTVQPIEEIGALCRRRGAFLFVDAVQTAGHLPLNVEELGADMLAVSAHKFYGPKGVGALYVRKGVPLQGHVLGGGQELERRAGTENVPGIVGLAAALEISRRENDPLALIELRDRLISGVTGGPGEGRLTGHAVRRLPGHVHVTFDGVDSESLLVLLDMEGLAASAGSACAAGALEPSHVLQAMGVPKGRQKGALRLTLGRGNTLEEVEWAAACVARAVERLVDRKRLEKAAAKEG